MCNLKARQLSVGSIAIQLTNDLQTREILTSAVRQVVQHKKRRNEKYKKDKSKESKLTEKQSDFYLNNDEVIIGIHHESFYDVEIVVLPPYNEETGEYQDSSYKLQLRDFFES